MPKSKTAKAEKKIMKFAKRQREPFNLTADIAPLFDHDRSRCYTFAVWNLRRRGDLRRVGRGMYIR